MYQEFKNYIQEEEIEREKKLKKMREEEEKARKEEQNFKADTKNILERYQKPALQKKMTAFKPKAKENKRRKI